MSITFCDIFCGAGGSSIGLTAAGFELKLAANHWARAIETHSANFRDAEHLCADVNNYDMRRLPRTDILWASPICTEVSPAGGRRRKVKGQGELELFGPVAKEGLDRTRATFHDVIRATEVHRYQVVLVENVVDVAESWELFDWWVDGMKLLGYNVQFVSVSSAHVGGEGNTHAPQWRDRLYMVFTRIGMTLPDVEPRPLAYCLECGTDVDAVQSWKDHRKRKIGKYRQQYVYRCPSSACRHSIVEPYVSPASAAIDWTDLGSRIGDRKRPLAAATIARITAGLRMFAQPDVPVMVSVNHAGPDGRAYPVNSRPLPSQTVRIGDGFASHPFIAELRGGGSKLKARDVILEPLATVTASGFHHGLTVPPGHITTQDRHALVVPYYRTGKAKSTAVPLDTVTTKDRFALIDPAVDVDDCLFRMLKPREQLRAQRFPDTYTVLGNQGEQGMQAGNAVSSNVPQWIAGRVAAVLSGRAAA